MKRVPKAKASKFPWRGAGGLALVAAVSAGLWVAAERQTSSAQEGIRPTGPLISRGYTEAPAGTVVIAGSPLGGATVIDLRIKDGQHVKRDEIIAVLSGFPAADVSVRIAEAALAKLKATHDQVLMGTRVTQIALLEATLKSSIESNKLAALQRLRSGTPNDQKEMEATLQAESAERERAKLERPKQTLKNDLPPSQHTPAHSAPSSPSTRHTAQGRRGPPSRNAPRVDLKPEDDVPRAPSRYARPFGRVFRLCFSPSIPPAREMHQHVCTRPRHPLGSPLPPRIRDARRRCHDGDHGCAALRQPRADHDGRRRP